MSNVQNAQTHSNNSLANADELLECVDNFVGLALKGLKGDSGAVFFCEFCEVFKNNYFLEHIRTV